MFHRNTLLTALACLCVPPGLWAATCDMTGPDTLDVFDATGSNSNHYAQKVSLGAAAVVDHLRVYSWSNVSGGVTLALYEDLAGQPGRRIAATAAQGLSADLWNNRTLDPQPLLEAGSYWISSNGTAGGDSSSYLPNRFIPSLEAVYGPNSAHPNPPDFFGPVTGSYPGYALNLSYCAQAALSMAQALDNGQLVFSRSIPAPAFFTAQTAISNDGQDAAGVSVDAGQQASLFTSVDGPGIFRFYWSCATTGDDSRLILNINGGFDSYISLSPGWSQVVKNLGPGRQEIEWKMVNGDPGTQTAWLDQVEWLPATPTATPSPTHTRTATATATGTATPSFTPTSSSTDSPTATPTFTPTPTATSSATLTATQTGTGTWTATATSTVTATPTPSTSPTLSATASATEIFTHSATVTATPPFLDSAGLGRVVAGPVPAGPGQPVCLYFESQPLSTRWKIHNSAGDLVARLEFGFESAQCWDHAAVAPGLYYLSVKADFAGGGSEKAAQKLVILK